MKFPKELFIALDEADRQKFFVADTAAEVFAVSDDTRPVAKYALIEVGEVVNKSEYRPKTAKVRK